MSKARKPILDVSYGDSPDQVPVWLMRQAGRFLPEYREIRAKSKNFLNMCLSPDLATEITLQPVRRFGMDAAILFADILLVPMALGQSLEFREGEGPVLQTIDEKNFSSLSYDHSLVSPVFETVKRVKSSLNSRTALIGFCGAPWTVAAYMIDGNSKTNFARSRQWVQDRNPRLDDIISVIINASEKYLAAQIEAGAELVQIFDSWAGLLSEDAFSRYVIAPTRDLVTRLKKRFPEVPVIGFPREASSGYVPYIRETGVDVMSIDQNVDLIAAREDMQVIKPLQGNLSPDLLVKGGADMRKQVREILETFGPKHIFNLGHGVVPQTPPEHVAQLVSQVRAHSGIKVIL